MIFSDLSVIKSQLSRGDNSSLEIIFREQADFCIQNLIRKTNCTFEDAEDIFIESVMNFRERVISGQLTEIKSVRSYIYSTCKYMRISKIRKVTSEEKMSDRISNYLYEELGEDPFLKVENRQEEEKLLQLSKESFSQLGDKCQDILGFFYIENRKLAEIADLMKIANANVAKVLKYRCLKKLSSIAQGLHKTVTNGSR